MYRVLANETYGFKNTHINTIKIAYNEIRTTFGIPDGQTIAFMFRVGHGGEPSARSSRFSVDEVTSVIN